MGAVIGAVTRMDTPEQLSMKNLSVPPLHGSLWDLAITMGDQKAKRNINSKGYKTPKGQTHTRYGINTANAISN